MTDADKCRRFDEIMAKFGGPAKSHWPRSNATDEDESSDPTAAKKHISRRRSVMGVLPSSPGSSQVNDILHTSAGSVSGDSKEDSYSGTSSSNLTSSVDRHKTMHRASKSLSLDGRNNAFNFFFS